MKDTPESSNPNPGVAQTRGSDLHDGVVEGNLAADPDGARDNSAGWRRPVSGKHTLRWHAQFCSNMACPLSTKSEKMN